MNKKIYHYTKDNSFSNIIDQCKFRAVLSTQSNDLKDTVLLNELLIKSTKKIIQEVANESNELTVEGLTTILNNVFYRFNNDRTKNFSYKERAMKCFVICFTDKKDSRFLWKSYTENKGVNLAFDIEEIRSYLNEYVKKQKIFDYFRLAPVVYNFEDQYRAVRKIVNKNYTQYLKNGDNSLSPISIPESFRINFTDEKGNVIYRGDKKDFLITPKKGFVDFMNHTIMELLELAPYLKHHFWKEENEYRLTLYRPFKQDLLSEVLCGKRKDESGMEKPFYYIEIPFNKELLEGVNIGPLSSLSEENLVTKKINGHCTIGESDGKGVLKY